MEGNSFANNFTIYLLLIICVILVTVDSIELYRLKLGWEYSMKANLDFFNTCLKNELIVKTIYATFSFMTAISAFTLTLFLSVLSEFLLLKIMPTYLYMNYIIFGPTMLAFSVLGCYYFNDVVYMCDPKFFNEKYLSFSNVFTIVACFMISFVITICFSIYYTIRVLVDSILKKEDGYKIIRKAFWWTVLRSRTDEDLNILTNRQYIEQRMNI